MEPFHFTTAIDPKDFYGPTPIDPEPSASSSISGRFPITRMGQRHILDVLAQDPVDEGHLKDLYDVSLAETLSPIWQSVGIMMHTTGQVGSCALISSNLAMIPCHCIEDIDVRDLFATFGYAQGQGQSYPGTYYQVEGIVEFDATLDYAIIQLKGNPGQQHNRLEMTSISTIDSEFALLHHPLRKPLQVSVHAVIPSNYHTESVFVYHDSHYGSSGGAYISPKRKFVALHLGSERYSQDLNLERLALPIQAIIAKNKQGIVAKLAYNPNYEPKEEIITYWLQPFLRNFIDVEKWEDSRLKDKKDYYLKYPTENLPGIIIDNRQKKHAFAWPAEYKGDHGSMFKVVSVDDILQLAEIIVEDKPEFKTIPPGKVIPKAERWEFDKKTLGNELFKKLSCTNVRSIGIESAFIPENRCWEFHIFPVYH